MSRTSTRAASTRSRLLNDLLDISKIEAGKFELNFTAVDVPELVEDCVGSLQPLAKRARIVLRTSLAPDLPTIVADPRRLKQILLNLLTNAIKFTKEGGQVIVSGTLVDGELRLRVRDNGVGMTKDEIAFAMQPFHQLDTAPRKQTGTGLGLPVTKALVDANRARLVLTSEPGVGTSADVIFPAERLFTGSGSAEAASRAHPARFAVCACEISAASPALLQDYAGNVPSVRELFYLYVLADNT